MYQPTSLAGGGDGSGDKPGNETCLSPVNCNLACIDEPVERIEILATGSLADEYGM